MTKDSRQKIPSRPEFDSLDLALLGGVYHSQGEHDSFQQIIGELKQASRVEGKRWLGTILTNDRQGYRRLERLENKGYIVGYAVTDRGRSLVEDLKRLGTIIVDPLDNGFNLNPAFGLYYIPNLGHPALAFDGTLLGITKTDGAAHPTTMGLIQGSLVGNSR